MRLYSTFTDYSSMKMIEPNYKESIELNLHDIEKENIATSKLLFLLIHKNYIQFGFSQIFICI